MPPATFRVAPLVRETGWPEDAVIVPVVRTPAAEGALNVSVEFVEIAVVVRFPVDAVTVRADVELIPAKVTVPEEMVAVFLLERRPVAVTDPA